MHLENVVFDAADPQRLGRFWEALLDCERLTDEPAGFETRLTVEGGPVLDLCFQRVADVPIGPSRLHPDLAGVEVGTGDGPEALRADPEGNPFRVLEAPGSYAGTGPLAVLGLDSADPHRDTQFWAWLTGWTVSAPLALRHTSRRGPVLELRPESAAKGSSKNRVHLDVRLESGEDPEEVAAGIEARGGRELHPRRAAVADLRRPVRQRVLRAARCSCGFRVGRGSSLTHYRWVLAEVVAGGNRPLRDHPASDSTDRGRGSRVQQRRVAVILQTP